MRIGFCGAGTLGLSCAAAIDSFMVHEVSVYDINPKVKEYLDTKSVPYTEPQTMELLQNHNIQWAENHWELVEHSDLIFVPVQTPHDKAYEGITPMPDEYKDFDYSFLKEAINKLATAALWSKKHVIINIVSTVLPGTIEREIKPLLNKYAHLTYNPFFIALSQIVSDFLNPEFVLLGSDGDEWALDIVKEFYKTIHNKPVCVTDIKTAELTKVAYNCYLSSKILFANEMMMICDKMGANVDDLSDALALATDRLISPAYMRGGGGDSGSCHPRDGIAMAYLEKRLNIHDGIFNFSVRARESQTYYLVRLIEDAHRETGLPIYILGTAYKKNVNITVGSYVLLLIDYLRFGIGSKTIFDPYVDRQLDWRPTEMAIYFIGTNHDIFKEYKFPEDSVVIDPWGMIEDQDGVVVNRVGRN